MINASRETRPEALIAAVPKLYAELAAWWPLMSAPADYEEEAASYARLLAAGCDTSLRTVLELGSGGGNNASHLKARFQMVLVEPSAGMPVPRPESRMQHVPGDMRTVILAVSSTQCSSTMPCAI